MNLSETFKLRLEPELLAELNDRAEREKMPASLIVRRALRLYLQAVAEARGYGTYELLVKED